MNALNVLCAQLTRDLFAIATFLSSIEMTTDTIFIYCDTACRCVFRLSVDDGEEAIRLKRNIQSIIYIRLSELQRTELLGPITDRQ